MDGIKYRRPEEMRDSGVEWLSNMPQDWDCIRLKYLSRYKASNVDKLTVEGEYPVSLCNYVDVYKNVYITDELNFMQATATKQEIKNFTLNEGYILITKDSESPNDIAIPAYVPKKLVNVLCGYHLSIIDANQLRLSSKYLFQFLNSIGARNYFETRANGITIYALGMESFKNIIIPDCDLLEQQKIANFLDIKTAQFDSIISKKELLIKKLEEAKKSLISEVVTGKMKIVDGEMVKRQPEEMKNSGIEWLGMISKEWVVKRIKNLFSLRNERNHKSMDEVQILSLYTALGVKRQEEIENKTGNVVRTVLDYKIVHPKDIVVNIILAWMGAIGVSQDKGVISPAYDIYKPYDNINSDYYSYLFRTSKFAGECFKYGRGIMLMRWRTYSDQFMSIYCCCPNKTEQDQIAEFIDRKIRDIDTVVEKNKLHIQKLKEAKQALISEAVTGKIDLRDWEIIEEGGLQ